VVDTTVGSVSTYIVAGSRRQTAVAQHRLQLREEDYGTFATRRHNSAGIGLPVTSATRRTTASATASVAGLEALTDRGLTRTSTKQLKVVPAMHTSQIQEKIEKPS